MKYDYDRQEEKKAELFNKFKQISIKELGFDDKNIINQILEQSIIFFPPKKEIYIPFHYFK